MQIFNARTQQDEDVVFSLSPDKELVATFEGGGFLKFPAGTSQKDLDKLAKIHKVANEGQEVVTEAMLAEEKKAQAFIDKLNGGTPQEDTTDAPTEDASTV